MSTMSLTVLRFAGMVDLNISHQILSRQHDINYTNIIFGEVDKLTVPSVLWSAFRKQTVNNILFYIIHIYIYNIK